MAVSQWDPVELRRASLERPLGERGEPDLDIYRSMFAIRSFELAVNDLFLRGLVPGTIHLSHGQEATVVGTCLALRPDDVVTPTHRGHGHCLARGVAPRELLAELLGKETGCCGGRGGSLHVGKMSLGVFPAIAIVAAAVPLAAGLAFAYRRQGTDRVVCAFFGDGAANKGDWHEAMNLAALWSLPMIFLCENNHYASTTRISDVMLNETISERAAAYRMRGLTVDGNDPLVVFDAVRESVVQARAGRGPTLIECLTYRRGGHKREDPGTYRPTDEVEAWLAYDPVATFRERLLRSGLDEARLLAVERDVASELDEAVEFALASPVPGRRVCNRACLRLSSSRNRRASRLRDRNLTIVKRSARPSARSYGQTSGTSSSARTSEIGGAFLVTLGMVDEFGADRVINTPISESGFMGLAAGAAVAGLRPIVDFQYGDFLFTAADQLIQQAAKLRHMSNGQVAVPLLVQLPTGASGRGAQHANSLESFFFNVPGIEIVTPATPYDAKGLLKTSLRDDNIVLFCVHKHLYGSKGRPLENASTSTGVVPADEYLIPLGRADIKRAGTDATVVANLLMLHRSLEAAERLSTEGIDVEVIDPRTLVPFDVDTVVSSVEKTGRLLVVEENHRRGGWGGWLVAEVVERALPYLDAPVRRITLPDSPIPFSPPLEASLIPSSEQIADTLRTLVAG